MDAPETLISQAKFQTDWHVITRPYAPSEAAIAYWEKHGGGDLLLAIERMGSAYFEVLRHDDTYHIIRPVDIHLVSFDANEVIKIYHNLDDDNKFRVDKDFVDSWIKMHGSTRLKFLYTNMPNSYWRLVYDREIIAKLYDKKYWFCIKCDFNKYNVSGYPISFNLNNVYHTLVGRPDRVIDFIVDGLVDINRRDLINGIFDKEATANKLSTAAQAVGLRFLSSDDLDTLCEKLRLINRNWDLYAEHTVCDTSRLRSQHPYNR